MTTTLDEIQNGDFFKLKDRIFQKTDKTCGYNIICTMLYNGCDVLLDRGTEVEKVINDD